jgi:hypothetical protein
MSWKECKPMDERLKFIARIPSLHTDVDCDQVYITVIYIA